jgi:hypothetical protein
VGKSDVANEHVDEKTNGHLADQIVVELGEKHVDDDGE